MRRARIADVALLVPLLALWVACTALHVRELVAGQLAWVGVYVTPSTGDGDFPTVRGFWPGAPPGASGALAVGDRLLRAGDTDLRGVGPFGFVARVHGAAAARRDLRATVTYERKGVVADSTIDLVPVAFPWRMLPLTAGLVATGALVLIRRPGVRIARAFFLLAVAYGLHWTFFFGGSALQTRAWTIVFLATSLTMLPLILRAALVFPPATAPPDGRLPWWPWLFAAFGPISSSWIYGTPLPPELGFRAAFLVNVTFIVALLVVLTRNFRRADAMGRRQLKWVVLGIYVGTVPVLLADVAAALTPALWWLHDVAVIAEICIPLCILIAIVRADLFDVDRLITGTAVYSILSIVVLAAAMTAVPLAAHAASRAAHLDVHTVQLVLSVVVAATVVPGNRLLRPRLERLLFRERHALREGVEDLLRDLAAASGPEELLTLVGERLESLVRPQTCVIYAPLADGFAPVFARGTERHGVPPILSADTAAILALRTRTTPLDVEPSATARGGTPIGTEDTALAQLRAAVLLPVRRGTDLAAAICLGTKRSGDVYTPDDLALLAAVAERVSGELQHFDTALILRQERKMSATLRRYVPQSVAAHLTRGRAIEGGERDVSVLFVDIRGYTAYSETRAVGAVFSTISRYSEAVSAVIERHGGTIVEFLGDGFMAVFGAPDTLPDHARVSVEAAFEVVAMVRGLALGAGEGAAPIGVGVGIASGRAFVGNLRTSDRLVYTAVGDVVNLASRIQGLTRELHAVVAIDERTHRAAGDAAASFERHARVRIRGRAEAVDVYSMAAIAA